ATAVLTVTSPSSPTSHPCVALDEHGVRCPAGTDGLRLLTVKAGGGRDVVRVVGAPIGVSSQVTLIGGDGDDTLSGDTAGETLSGGPGDDTLSGGDAADWLDGGAG